MATEKEINEFLAHYDEQVVNNALKLRKLLNTCLPGITEQVDLPAKMIAYCYGQKCAELICVLIPSKKGLKLGFNRGNELPDPGKLLEGTGNISRYIQIKSEEQIKSAVWKKILLTALKLYNKKAHVK